MAAVPQYPVEIVKFPQYVQERKRKRVLLKGEFMVSILIYFHFKFDGFISHLNIPTIVLNFHSDNSNRRKILMIRGYIFIRSFILL